MSLARQLTASFALRVCVVQEGQFFTELQNTCMRVCSDAARAAALHPESKVSVVLAACRSA